MSIFTTLKGDLQSPKWEVAGLQILLEPENLPETNNLIEH